MYGGSNKKVVVRNSNVEGASKSELKSVVAESFPGLSDNGTVIQIWDKDFDEFVDIGEGRILGPTKIRVNEVMPVSFTQDVLERGGVATVLTDSEESCSLQDSTSASDGGDLEEDAPKDSVDTLEDSVDPPKNDTHEDKDSVGTWRPTSSGSMTRFRLPTQPPSLEMKAKAGVPMNLPERGLFLQNIYDAFVKATGSRLPTKAMYEEMVNQLFIRYPKLSHSQPNLQGASVKAIWKNRILDKFRNCRKRQDSSFPEVQARKRSAASTSDSSRTTKKVAPSVPQWGMMCYLPSRPASEDDTTIAKHEDFLKKEKGKREPDYRQVRLSMTKTFADRRKWLVTMQPRPRLVEVKERFPWLFDIDQLSTEMGRLQNDETPVIVTLKEGLSKYAKALVSQGNGKKKAPQSYKNAVAAVAFHRGEEERKEAMSKAAFLAIPGLLQEKLEDIFVSPEAEPSNPVYIRMNKCLILDSNEFQLVADGETVATADEFFAAVSVWITSFYVFNLEYPKSLSKTLMFCQKILLNIIDEEATPRSVVTLVNKLNNYNISG